jgi:hypothetical protein
VGPKQDFSKEADEVLDELLARKVDTDITIKDVNSLPNREATRVLIAVLVARAKHLYPEFSNIKKAIILMRFDSNTKLMRIMNDKTKLKEHMDLMTALIPRYAPDPMKAPLDHQDMFIGQTMDDWVQACARGNAKEKHEAILNILLDWMLRNYKPDTNLVNIFEEMKKMPFATLVGYASTSCLLTCFIWGKGKENGCRFCPLELPNRHYRLKIKDQEGKKNVKKKPKGHSNENPYSSLSAPDKDDGEEEGKDDKASQKQDQTEVSEDKMAEAKAQAEAQEAQMQADAAKEAERYSNELAAQREAEKNQPLPSDGEKLFEDLAEFEGSLRDPSKVIKLDPQRIRVGTDHQVKAYMEVELRPYLFSHYGSDGEPLLARLLDMNIAGILDLIKTPGELLAYAKARNFKPARRLDSSSPLKSRGNHPFKSNTVKTYELLVTKIKCKNAEMANEAVLVITKLFDTVEKMGGGHIITLQPYNPATDASVYYDPELIASEKSRLKGIYLGQMATEKWMEKIS